MPDEFQFSREQAIAAVRLIEAAPWGDLKYDVADIERMLRAGLEVCETALGPMFEAEADFFNWDFMDTPASPAESSDTENLVYVARCLYWAAMWFGLVASGGEGGRVILSVRNHSPQQLLVGLVEVSRIWVPRGVKRSIASSRKYWAGASS